MSRIRVPLHFKVLLNVSGFVALIAILGAVTIWRLVDIDQLTEDTHSQWLGEVHLLEEIDHSLTELGMSELDWSRAATQDARAEAEQQANRHRLAVEYSLATYFALPLEQQRLLDLTDFLDNWRNYARGLDTWHRVRASGTAGAVSAADAAMRKEFDLAHEAIDRRLEASHDWVRIGAEVVDDAVGGTILLMAVILGAAFLAGGHAYYRVRKQIIAPLSAMTDTMSRLARGDRGAEVPALDRDDEIGALAKAFNIFKANAIALEEAHEAARAAEEHAQSLARHDALTGLPNRRVFAQALADAIAEARRGTLKVAVLMIDLDRFKPVNDLLGHAAGDFVLCEVAKRLTAIVRQGDTAARLGGDEFAVICREGQATFPNVAISIAQRILSSLSAPMQFGEDVVEVGASIGIASFPNPAQTAETLAGVDSEELLRAADIAMYDAKRSGRGVYRFFEKSMDAELRARAALETDLRLAVAEGRIEPYYQPLVAIPDGTIYGFEVLARWRDVTRGMVSPEIFIPIAEQLGLIGELTWSVLRRSCRQARAWPNDIRLSVNISPLHLKDATLPTKLLTILNQEGFAPSRLEVEVTETALVSDIEGAKVILSALQSVGIKVALDDFGTGYSSLYHLRELKFDKVKIDRSFVQSIEESMQSRQIVEAILSLARNLQMPAIAEGVESGSIADQLTMSGCDFAQGYHFGRPMTGAQATELLLGSGAGADGRPGHDREPSVRAVQLPVVFAKDDSQKHRIGAR